MGTSQAATFVTSKPEGNMEFKLVSFSHKKWWKWKQCYKHHLLFDWVQCWHLYHILVNIFLFYPVLSKSVLIGASDYWLLDWCQWFRHHHSLTYISVAPGGPNMIVFRTGHGPRVLSCLRKIDCKACGDICFAALHPFHLQGLASTPSSTEAMIP